MYQNSHVAVILPSFLSKPAPHAAAYKPNAAFFEALGPNLGAACLRKVIKSIPDDIPVLLDVKRGDIGSTAQAYAEACYEREEGLSADGVTLSPLMGWDSVQPFVTGEFLKTSDITFRKNDVIVVMISALCFTLS